MPGATITGGRLLVILLLQTGKYMQVSELQKLPFFTDRQITDSVFLPSHSHNNWKVTTINGEQFFVRVYLHNPLLLNHRNELRCLLKAARRGIAPEPLYYRSEPAVLVSRYLPDARHFGYQPARGMELAKILAEFHLCGVKVPVLNGLTYLEQLLAASAEPALVDLALFEQLVSVVKFHSGLPQDIVVCHRDLTPENILLSAERLYLIDFEYVCLADASFDLATISFHHQLSEMAEQQWLSFYCTARNLPGSELPQLHIKVKLAKVIYCGWCWLWYLMQPDFAEHTALWQQKLRSLLSDLPADI